MTPSEEQRLGEIFLNYKWSLQEGQSRGGSKHRQSCVDEMVRNGWIHKSARIAAELASEFNSNVATEFCDLLEKAEAAALDATEKPKLGDPGFSDWANGRVGTPPIPPKTPS